LLFEFALLKGPAVALLQIDKLAHGFTPFPRHAARGCGGGRATKIASAARARVPPEPQRCHSGPLIAPLGLPQKGGFDSGVQVRRYAHDWNLVETLAEMAECKISGGIGGLDCGT
jgi:hypothetical protein